MKSPDHQRLMTVLNRMVTQERWQRMPKKKGKLIKASLTKSGNLKLTLKGKEEFAIYVLRRNKNLFQAAQQFQKGETISIALRYHLGKGYVIKIFNKKKDRALSEFTA